MKNCTKDYTLSKVEKENLKDFGYLIRIYKLLELNPITKKELSHHIDVPESTLNKYLNKEKPIPMTIECLVRLSNYFNVSTDYLLGITNVKSIDLNIRDVSEKTGLSEDAIVRLQLTKNMGFNDLLSDFILNSNFISGLAQANRTICMEIKDGYGYAFMSKKDADKMNEGESVQFVGVHSSVIANMYMSKSKNDFCKAIEESVDAYCSDKKEVSEELKRHIQSMYGNL